MTGIIEAFGKEWLTLLIGWEDMVIDIKLLNGTLSPIDSGNTSWDICESVSTDLESPGRMDTQSLAGSYRWTYRE